MSASPRVTPVFTGGTGRSGTTVIAGLLGRHPLVRASVPREVKFLTEQDGLLDLCVGPSRHRRQGWRRPSIPALGQGSARRRFLRSMRGRWWERTNRMGRASGLHLSLSEEQRERLLMTLEQDLRRGDRIQAGRRFVEHLIREQGQDTGEPFWVDTSPPNLAEADRMLTLLPDALFIWMVRDGRSTAASVLAERWGPRAPEQAIVWWERRLRESHAGVARVPAERVLTVRLEDLVVHERTATYGRILDFLALDDDPGMRRFFERRMPADRARLGSWRERVPYAAAFEEAYRQARERLLVDGLDPMEDNGG